MSGRHSDILQSLMRFREKHRLLVDLFLYTALFVVLLVKLIAIDAFDLMHEFTRTHEHWELDEIILALWCLAVTACAFLVQRWRFDRREKRALEARHHDLERAVESAPYAVMMTDTALEQPGPRILYVNRAFEEMTGWSRTEILGRTPRVLQGPKTDRRVLATLAANLRAGRTWHGEAVNYRRDGRPFNMAWSVSAVRASSGETLRYMAIQRDVTEQRKTQAARDHLSALVDRLMEAASEGILVADKDGQIVHFGAGAEKIFGWSSSEIVGQSASVLIPERRRSIYPDAASMFEQNVTQSGVRGRADNFIGLRRDGQEFPASATISHLLCEENQGYAVILRDLTQQRLAERALRESERRFRALFDRAYQSIFLLDIQGRVRELNATAQAALGLSSVAQGGMPFWDLSWWVHPDDAKSRLQDAVGRAAGGETVRVVMATSSPEGTERMLDLSLKPVRGDDDGVTMLVAEGRDVTELLQHQAELERSAARMRNAQRIGRMNSWFYDPVEDVYYVDGSENTLFDFSIYGDRIDGPEARSWTAPEDRERVEAAFWNSLATGSVYDVEHRVCLPGGTSAVVHVRAEAIRKSDGTVEGLVGVAQDITEQHKTQQELIDARNAAEAASEAKSRFLATMGHELRTPLNAINGFAQLMSSEIFGPIGNEKYTEYARHIHESGEHLLEVINSILDVSRLERGTLALVEETFAIAPVIESAVALLQPAAAAREVRLDVHVANTSMLRADKRLIKQVILNLVNNAVKFSYPGGRISIDGAVRDDGGYLIAVTDHGVGIPQEAMDNVMLPFVQADDALHRRHEGIGLGLYLVKAFLDLHGGQVHLESVPDQGTRVTVVLPAWRVRTIRMAETVESEYIT
ncbi:PAS domain-containing sensor histidine kinase [Rhodovibrio salinarum]|uniref:histidine kinase n=1 Tax=Rhodovibrio salinarum TaxID=1087 RepID=A0A934QF54_9PROT|nr:PAS domain-containing sensor histidine kinase [Rhodovibrio salinarum]MBK1695824.1 PAS domain-containing sensor histidine kinase [Rhodovibrio salinarum]